jgi:hypothetical protein
MKNQIRWREKEDEGTRKEEERGRTLILGWVKKILFLLYWPCKIVHVIAVNTTSPSNCTQLMFFFKLTKKMILTNEDEVKGPIWMS